MAEQGESGFVGSARTRRARLVAGLIVSVVLASCASVPHLPVSAVQRPPEPIESTRGVGQCRQHLPAGRDTRHGAKSRAGYLEPTDGRFGQRHDLRHHDRSICPDRAIVCEPGSGPRARGILGGSARRAGHTFHLKSEKWSNGDPVTADDVKFSIDRFADQDLDQTAGFLAVNVKDVVIVDPSTIRIEMKQVDASILTALTLMEARSCPRKSSRRWVNKFGEDPVGSGPFMVKSWTPGQPRAVKNPYYHNGDGRSYLDGVTFQFVKDDNARILMAQSNQAQVIEAVPISDAATIKGLQGWTLDNDAILAQDNVWLNNSWKDASGNNILGDKSIRQALNYATPKDDINNVVFNGLALIRIPGPPSLSIGIRIPSLTPTM